ncbi:amidohydrolase [Mucilaginibacter phyllosphaerae]|uniref:Amidohydrolase n=1 Tax=Mucilaginibacter phyllosphaerae TaxID=1812349 RepID=A0A4Y8A628_9SPHI|nr:amidohydrolase [Mucilaginibacter phyllosphaerae]MBB3971061.1 amidohydrolase [Mucilaginibacter phyllosphaerae]TEW63799.1 amidohydrolase [Mucilaginibacter phyllosphaerae]GGH22244.1 N-acyl-L-amino acid amidohydrolase [Mucilaginibacter phyllosphaerae]
MKKLLTPLFCFVVLATSAQTTSLKKTVNTKADALKDKVIAWRRDFHEHPELGNHEVRTADIIAKHLQSLGIEAKTGVATTGVVGVLKGGLPGPVVALRADMDGLPVTERVNLPFASKVKTQYNGQEVGVMHACGHDSHMAILMGVAEVLSSMKKDLHGTVKFIFQPAEEGAPVGEKGGAEEMVKQGVMENPKVDVIFGLHINSQTEVGKITYKPGGTMAGVSDLQIIVKGRSAHGAYPWSSVDPVVVSAQIISSLQSIVSRNINVTENPAVVTIGVINGGSRFNIIPESVKMQGTLRYFTDADEKLITANVKRIAIKTAEAYGAQAEVLIPYSNKYPVTFNDEALTAKMLPTLAATAGKENVILRPPVTGAEDFSFYQQKVPGIFFFLGGMPKGGNALTAPSHHTPDFYLDESGFTLGVKALCNLTLDYMAGKGK